MLHETTTNDSDWLGLTRLASALTEIHAPASLCGEARAGEEVVDRLYRMLEILALVEENSQALRTHAGAASDQQGMQLAVDLRRLANRLQAVGDFLTNAGDGILELEDKILLELDERYRVQSSLDYATRPGGRWPSMPRVVGGA
jgi:hypothetical protein